MREVLEMVELPDLSVTATSLELFVMSLLVFALPAAIWGLWDAVLDLRAQYSPEVRVDKRKRRRVAWGGVRREALRVVRQAGYTLATGLALVTVPPAKYEITMLGVVVSVVIIIAIITDMINVWWDRYDRHRLLRDGSNGDPMLAEKAQEAWDGVERRKTQGEGGTALSVSPALVDVDTGDVDRNELRSEEYEREDMI